jgi:hypothetical protein
MPGPNFYDFCTEQLNVFSFLFEATLGVKGSCFYITAAEIDYYN